MNLTDKKCIYCDEKCKKGFFLIQYIFEILDENELIF
jgi:hypothetical protein